MKDREQIAKNIVYESLDSISPKKEIPRSLTKRQKKFILERDNYKCQAGFNHACHGKLNVHHIHPVGYSLHFGLNPHYSRNLITLCNNAHDVIHPDSAEAKRHWHAKSDVFIKVYENREKLLKKGEPYWRTDFDRQLLVIAAIRSQQVEAEGKTFPERKEEETEGIDEGENILQKLSDLQKELENYIKSKN